MATLLLIRVVYVKFVSKMLGHATTTSTLEKYNHVMPPMRGGAAAMDTILSA